MLLVDVKLVTKGIFKLRLWTSIQRMQALITSQFMAVESLCMLLYPNCIAPTLKEVY